LIAHRFPYPHVPFLGTLLLAVVLSGCASRLPESIRDAAVSELSVAQVRKGDVQQYTGTEVRWGGSIAVVENTPSETLIEVVSQPLGQDGRPDANGDGDGRFIAKFPGFLDPLVYDKQRQLTVVGTLRGEVTRKIGEYAYTFPVVEVQSHHLWKEMNRSGYNAGDWWRYDCYPFPYYRYPWPYVPYYW
jgi:outer membrane lipoprotein